MSALITELDRAGYGVERLPGQLVPGEIYRLPAPGKGTGNQSGWLVVHSDDAATYGDWSTGEQADWFANNQTKVDIKPLPRPKKRLDETRQASKRAQSIWNSAAPARHDHQYLNTKEINGEGLRQNNAGCLIVPMFDSNSPAPELVNLQFIGSNGTKRFLKGARKAGAFYRLPGRLPRVFVEGLATGKTVNAATGREVIVTFDAGNLLKVTANMAGPGDVVAADNDNAETRGTLFSKRLDQYGTGHKYAEKTGLPYFMPSLPGADFNDVGAEETDATFQRPPISKTPMFDAWHLEPIPLKQSNDKALIKLLSQAETPAVAAAAAKTAANRLSMRAPAGISLIQIRSFIEQNVKPGLIHPVTLDRLIERLTYAQAYRKAAALEAVEIPAEFKQRHHYAAVESLPKLQPEDYQGVIIVRAPMASGKTSLLGASFANWAAKQEHPFLGICHRVSLTLEMATKLNAEHYQSVPHELAYAVRSMVTCLPSILKPEHDQAISNAGYIFIDEISQVLRFLRDPTSCSIGTKTNQDIYEKLCEIVKNARCVVVTDAGVDRRTLDFLELCRPGERFRIIEMEQQKEQISASYVMGGNATEILIGDCLTELAAGGKVWIASESKDRAKIMGDYFTQQGYKTLTVNAATKGNREQQRFLSNIEQESRYYDVVIASPTISSGVSVEHRDQPQHFTLGAFIGSGIRITPADASQMLRRVRYLKRYVIGFLPNNQIGNQSSEALIRSMEAAARVEGDRSRATSFDEFIADIKAGEDNQRADFSAGLLWLLDTQNWKLERHESADNDLIAAGLKSTKLNATETKIKALIATRVITDEEAKQLQLQPERTEEQNLILEAHRIRKALNVTELDRETIEFWNEGRCISMLDRFSVYNGITTTFDESKLALSNRRYSRACARAYQYLFDGIEIEDGHWITDATAMAVIDRMLQQRHLLAYLGIIPKKFGTWKVIKGELQPAADVKYPVRELQAVLAKMGLKTKGKQVRDVHRSGINFISEKGGSVYKKAKRGRAYSVTQDSWNEIEKRAFQRNAGRLIEMVRPRPIKTRPKFTNSIGAALKQLQTKLEPKFVELEDLPPNMTLREALAGPSPL